MILAIDFDNTYTTAPELWDQVIRLFQEAGHTVICITGRTENMSQPVLDTIGKLVPVIFAGKDWKRTAAKNHGYQVDIWIDDIPEMIGKQFVLS
jgi:hypothetical protein